MELVRNTATDQSPPSPALRVSALVMVDADGREHATLSLIDGVPTLILKREQACCIITPDGLATFDKDGEGIVELVTAYGFPSGIEEELVTITEPLAVR